MKHFLFYKVTRYGTSLNPRPGRETTIGLAPSLLRREKDWRIRENVVAHRVEYLGLEFPFAEKSQSKFGGDGEISRITLGIVD
jgi:hypothetical protein